jgi:hypothetical protein
MYRKKILRIARGHKAVGEEQRFGLAEKNEYAQHMRADKRRDQPDDDGRCAQERLARATLHEKGHSSTRLHRHGEKSRRESCRTLTAKRRNGNNSAKKTPAGWQPPWPIFPTNHPFFANPEK